MVVNSLLHEFVDLLRDLLSSVEKSLLLIVLPVQSEVEHTNCLPEIAKLSAGSVDNPRNFVCNDEFKILQSSIL